MARSAVVRDTSDVTAAAIRWYREELAEPARVPWGSVEPECIGPSWMIGDDGRWILPQWSLGWGMLGWYGTWLQAAPGIPWRNTLEQARFTLWWYAVDELGRFMYRDGVLQRLKGWGKDPLGAVLCAGEMLGPCRFDGWGSDGQPVGTRPAEPWVQTAAVSIEQTKNTMRLFQWLFTPEAIREYGLRILIEKVHGRGGALIEAVTSSPATLEGARASFVLMNETQHWNASNQGHEMAAVIERNATKSPDAAARTLAITNAPMPGENSVAEQTRDAHDLIAAGQYADVGLLYDSLEAPAGGPEQLAEENAPDVIRAVRGDSVWLNIDRIVKSILDRRNPPSRSRRFWFNQLEAPEDAWCARREWEACKSDGLVLEDGDDIALFGDGSKSDDATALVACRLFDGAVFLLGCWQKPQHSKTWTVDRDDVDGIVTAAHELYRVRAFLFDPSPGEDEETGERYWDDLLDEWAARYGDAYIVKASERHPISWPMNRNHPAHVRDFTAACGAGLADLKGKRIPHDGNKLLRTHVVNMRRRPNRWGVSVGKEHRESSRKIDAGVCMIGSRMTRRMVLGSKEWKRLLRRATGQGRVVVLR